MGTLVQKLQYIDESKRLIREAIKEKGGDITERDVFRDYHMAIRTIPGGKLQEKVFRTSENCDKDVCPDPGFDGLSRVSVVVTVPESGTSKINTIILSPVDGQIRKECEIDYNADWSQVSMVSELFKGYSITNFNSIPNWDCENVWGLEETFFQARGLFEKEVHINVYPKARQIINTFRFSDLSNIIFEPDCFPQADRIDGAFCGTRLTTITLPNLPNVTNLCGTLAGNYYLKSVRMDNTPKVGRADELFQDDCQLTDVILGDLSTVEEISGMFDTGAHVSWGVPPDVQLQNEGYNLTNLTVTALPKHNLTYWGIEKQNQLTVESLMSIINALPQLDPEQQLNCQLGATNIAKLSEDQKLIATNKGWTLME